MVRIFTRVWINRVYGCQCWSSSAEQGKRIFPPVPVRAWEFGLARWVRPSRLASSFLFSTLRRNRVLSHGSPPHFRDGVIVHLYRQPPPGQSRVYRVTQLRTDGVYCQESAGTGPVVLKALRVTSAAFSGFTMWANCNAPLFSHTHSPVPPVELSW